MKDHKTPVMHRAVAAIVEAMGEIEANNGKEGYRHPFDKGLHVYCALLRSGLKVVRQPSKTKQ